MTETRKTEKSKSAAARAEANGEAKHLKFEGLELTMPPKLPFRVLRHAREDGLAATVGILETILGEEQLEQIWALDIDIARGEELVEQILDAYGLSLGES